MDGETCRINLRIPRSMRTWLVDRATEAHRSMNGQVLVYLEQQMAPENTGLLCNGAQQLSEGEAQHV